MRIIIAKDSEDMSRKAAHILAGQLIMKPESVLGIATGSTPVGTYRNLIKMYNEGLISFQHAVTFNLDEYYGLDASSDQSYRYFMAENLFDHVDIQAKNIHIPNGMCPDIKAECDGYEARIRLAGGIDMQLLGIGRNGHIGFNEPNVKFEAVTHLVELDEDTIQANSRFFKTIDEVPRKAISMGIKTIMHSKKILLLATGKEKANIIYNMIYGDIKPDLPASVLQIHPDVTILLDEAAAEKLVSITGTECNYIAMI